MPLPLHKNATKEDIVARLDAFKFRMLDEHHCAVQTYVHDKKWWLRASAQVFNEAS